MVRVPEALDQRLFTVEEYHRMAEAGILSPDERVEPGERVSPVSWPDVVIDVGFLLPDLQLP